MAEDAYLDQLNAGQRVRERARYTTTPGPVGTASTEVVVEVRSHTMPVPPSVLAEAETARRTCPAFTARSGNNPPIRFNVHAATPPALGQQSWRVDYHFAAGSGPIRITGHSSFLIVRVGHNLVTLYVTAIREPIDEKLVTKMVRAAVTALDT
ncbi:hypothetical protein AB0C02_02415 [Micromonospora sp. NPDC048999]|uniref:hypothetical protein n=1 Tax=Micromonospora sp. NPDC048999 TaxID=3155391 RepID=UPI0033D3C51F